MNVLIIDDDLDDIDIFCQALKELFPDATCSFKKTGQGLEKELRTLPQQDVIFLDAHIFPSGIECLQEIKKVVDPDATKVVIHTGGISPVEAEEFTKLGVSGIINKAESYQALKQTLLTVLTPLQNSNP